MRYNIFFSRNALKSICNLDNIDATIIFKWLNKNIKNCIEPRIYGNALKGKVSDYWSYRIGCYRAIAKIANNEITLIVINIGLHKEINSK